MTHTTATQLPVSFDDAGRGDPALVYLSGWCSSRAPYARMAELTARHNRTVVIDWRGHGTSAAASRDFGYPDMTDDVAAVLDACGIGRFVPVANAHAGWVALDLARRFPGRVAGIVLIDWLILGAPPEFTAGLTAMANPATTRLAVDSLTGSWLAGNEDVPGLAGQVSAMRQHDDEMWARASREITTAYAAHPEPLWAFAALPGVPPVRHLYAVPKDPSVLEAQRMFASAHPWFTVRRLDGARTHFPMLEQPAELAADVTAFTSTLA